MTMRGVLTLIAVLLVIPLGFVAVAAGVAAVFAHQRNARFRRGDEVGGWARARGWTMVEADQTVSGLACPPVDHGGRSRWVTRGYDGHGNPVVTFEWSHWESSSTTFDADGTATQNEVLTTVVASTVPGVHPMVQVSPGHPRRGPFGLGRPDPRTVPTGVAAFDERATMITDDPAGAARLLPRPVLERWAADPRTERLGFRLVGSWLVCWQPGGAGVERLDRGLAVIGDLRAAIDRSPTPA